MKNYTHLASTFSHRIDASQSDFNQRHFEDPDPEVYEPVYQLSVTRLSATIWRAITRIPTFFDMEFIRYFSTHQDVKRVVSGTDNVLLVHFREETKLNNEEKRELYEIGKELFAEMGYVEIGMDHFALPSDTLYKATQEKTLHRNFMGYTANKTQLMIGLGMSAISDSWYGFAQNVKTVKEYQKIVGEGEIPVFRGHILSEEDLVIRKHILNIMCHFSTSWDAENLQIDAIENHLEKLKEMETDGLVFIQQNGLTVPEKARPYVRNICMAFDKRLHKNKPETKLFSMTI